MGVYLGRINIDKIPETNQYLYKKNKGGFLKELNIGAGVREFMEVIWDMVIWNPFFVKISNFYFFVYNNKFRIRDNKEKREKL